MGSDKIKIDMGIRDHEYDGKTYRYLDTTVSINGEVINFYSDYEAFLFHSEDCRTWYEKEDKLQKGKFSDFTPFTCSCRESGCAGIWDGIHSKHRKHTVEWRLDMRDGYDKILDKTFYSFNRAQYEQEITKVWFWLIENAEALVHDEIFGDENSEPEPIQNIINDYRVGHPEKVEAAYRLHKLYKLYKK